MTEQCYRCEYRDRCKRKKEFKKERCPYFQDSYTKSSIKNILDNYWKRQEGSEQKVYDFINYMLIVEEKNENEVKEFLDAFEVGNADACNMIAISTQYHIDDIAKERQKEGRSNIMEGIGKILVAPFWGRRFTPEVFIGCQIIAEGIHKIKWVKKKQYSFNND